MQSTASALLICWTTVICLDHFKVYLIAISALIGSAGDQVVAGNFERLNVQFLFLLLDFVIIQKV